LGGIGDDGHEVVVEGWPRAPSAGAATLVEPAEVGEALGDVAGVDRDAVFETGGEQLALVGAEVLAKCLRSALEPSLESPSSKSTSGTGKECLRTRVGCGRDQPS